MPKIGPEKVIRTAVGVPHAAPNNTAAGLAEGNAQGKDKQCEDWCCQQTVGLIGYREVIPGDMLYQGTDDDDGHTYTERKQLGKANTPTFYLWSQSEAVQKIGHHHGGDRVDS